MKTTDRIPGRFYDGGWENGEVFVHQECPTCSRYCAMPETILVNGMGEVKAAATCKRCGPILLIAEYL